MNLAMKPAATTLGNLLDMTGLPELDVEGIALDSRNVGQGFAFFACQGIESHGLSYAEDAQKAGCSAIVYDADSPETAVPQLDVPAIAVPQLQQRLGAIADRFYARPSADINVIGVTGTNGKTTVTWLIAESLQLLDLPCAYAGTLGVGLLNIYHLDGMTTPDVFEGHKRLAILRDEGATHAAIEVSSHALAQGRVDGIRFKVVAFTNLSRDHLDYHGDMQSYEEAKARLFLEHDAEIKVVNIDTDAGMRLASRCSGPVVTVSMIPDADASVVIRSAEPNTAGFELTFDSAWGQGEISLPLLGSFNVENAALVLAVLLSLGVTADDASRVMSRVVAPPGRLQSLGSTSPRVVVDYAHTPDALESALLALRSNCEGRLWCVFGCGGDRDRGKRPMMASVAERYADRVVITNDNPRGEAPTEIFADIVGGLDNSQNATVIEDRGSAIAWVIGEAAESDLVLIAGKGHEQTQIIGERRIPFLDADVAAACLEKRAGVPS